jgi:hypothetical protein
VKAVSERDRQISLGEDRSEVVAALISEVRQTLSASSRVKLDCHYGLSPENPMGIMIFFIIDPSNSDIADIKHAIEISLNEMCDQPKFKSYDVKYSIEFN